MTYLPPVIDADTAQERLALIFPREALDTVLSGPLAGHAVAALLYVGAISEDDVAPQDWRWARPTTVLWLTTEALLHDSDDERSAWYTAALRSNESVTALLTEWGEAFSPRYRENSRETLRDETLRQWRDLGAARVRAGLPTASSAPRWALDRAFADLFHPDLEGAALDDAIDAWTDAHMSTAGKLKAFAARRAADATHAVTVHLPTGGTRILEAGRSSLLLQSVVEEWARRKLLAPLVLTISEPGEKLLVADKQQLAALGMQIDVGALLPDALVVDSGGPDVTFWIIEAVVTDGPVTPERKTELLDWARGQGIPAERCQFLTAFESRNAAPAKRRLKDLAEDSYAWFADEPDLELHWRSIEHTAPPHLAPVTPIGANQP